MRRKRLVVVVRRVSVMSSLLTEELDAALSVVRLVEGEGGRRVWFYLIRSSLTALRMRQKD